MPRAGELERSAGAWRTRDWNTLKSAKSDPKLQRTALRTSRLLDFLSQRELTAQIGHPPSAWPLVLVKELVDNSLDACEEAGIAPEILVQVDEQGILVTDNGPGIPPEVGGRCLGLLVARVEP